MQTLRILCKYCADFCTKKSGLEKTSRISEFSGGRLFEKIEWGPPLKTEKLLWVMKKTEKARIEWGGSHSILATGARRNPELRGGSHSILSKRRPFRGSSHSILSKRRPLRGGSHSILATGGIQNLWVLPFCHDRMAAAPHLEVLNPFYSGNKVESRISWKKILEKAVEKNSKKTMKKDKKL